MVLVAICDDNPQALSRYASAVTQICSDNGIPLQLVQYATGTQLLFAIEGREDPPDIVLLDIGMPKIDGIETAQALRDRGFAGVIVFVTVKDDRMLDAFDVDAFNYVVKGAPDERQRFERVFLKAAERMQARHRRYLLCNGISEHRNIPLDAIRYFSMNRHVCTVHYGQGKTFDFVTTMQRLENMLGASGFVRVQRSYMVNCEHVASYTYSLCTLDDGTRLSVGRKHASALRQMTEQQAYAIFGGAVNGGAKS